ncbi:MAG: hypothetical protein Q9219_002442 [cf. Caloplaca sp. 3 TL-2023]
MDFIEGIGQRYLERKANAAPQQLEDLAKKRLKGNDSPKAATTANPQSAAQNVDRDKEIEKLRRELAEAKLGEAKSGKHVTDSRSLGGTGGEKPRESPARAKSISGLSERPSHDHASSGKGAHQPRSTKEPSGSVRRGRSSSVKTAIAAKHPSLEHDKHDKHEDIHKSYLNAAKPLASTAGSDHRRPPLLNHVASAKSPAHEGEKASRLVQGSTSQRPRTATDYSVVEVIEEEPQRRQRAKPRSRNTVDLVERDRNRTRYVVR